MVDDFGCQPKLTTNYSKLTMKRIRPGTEHDALSIRLMFLKIQQVTDQHLNLCSVTSEALHFADFVEEIRVDIVVLDHTSRLGNLFLMSYLLSGGGVWGIIFDAEFLQLVLIDGNTRNDLQ